MTPECCLVCKHYDGVFCGNSDSPHFAIEDEDTVPFWCPIVPEDSDG